MKWVIGLLLMLCVVPVYGADICDPISVTSCVGVNSTATGGGWHTSTYGTSPYDRSGNYAWQKATYNMTTALSAAASATANPQFYICGSTTRVVTISSIAIYSTVATTAVRVAATLRQTVRPIVSTTAVSLVATPYDSKNGASTVSILNAPPASSNASVDPDGSKIVGTQTELMQVTATIVATDYLEGMFWNFVKGNEASGPMLRGTNECLEVVISTGTIPSINIDLVWTESLQNY